MSAAAIQAARAVGDKLRAQVMQGEAGRAWQAMPLSARCLLIMVALDPSGSVEAQALRPWASFTADEQISIGALARTLRRQLESAEALR